MIKPYLEGTKWTMTTNTTIVTGFVPPEPPFHSRSSTSNSRIPFEVPTLTVGVILPGAPVESIMGKRSVQSRHHRECETHGGACQHSLLVLLHRLQHRERTQTARHGERTSRRWCRPEASPCSALGNIFTVGGDAGAFTAQAHPALTDHHVSGAAGWQLTSPCLQHLLNQLHRTALVNDFTASCPGRCILLLEGDKSIVNQSLGGDAKQTTFFFNLAHPRN